ncbi:DUF411 domain-containing protein [Luteimonas sp. WGS1318]|uniref:DUF411 domain-containing protein n=1 Tax=Luteimonas sp. WGS1318 TaxID=3366815 RepID=UPI00372D7CC3
MLVVEGHVPATAINRVLAASDGIEGLVLSGMRAGSPGVDLRTRAALLVKKIDADCKALCHVDGVVGGER